MTIEIIPFNFLLQIDVLSPNLRNLYIEVNWLLLQKLVSGRGENNSPQKVYKSNNLEKRGNIWRNTLIPNILNFEEYMKIIPNHYSY